MMPWAKDPIERWARFSEPDRRFRYALRRRFTGIDKPLRLCVWMNPSTADENDDDASIRVGLSFARKWGDGGILVVNVLSLVLTDSTALPKDRAEAIGPEHWLVMREVLDGEHGAVHKDVFCGWGDAAAGVHAEKTIATLRRFGYRTCAIARTSSGNPGHLLRKSLDLPLLEF